MTGNKNYGLEFKGMLTAAVCRLISLLIFSLSLITICAHAQDVSPSPAPPDVSPAVDNDETIRVETDLVDLNISVFSLEAQQAVGALEQKDFKVYEDGVAQEISFFASADTPFDLVLLIDLSGSTSDKLKLIRKSATSFVEAVRPSDRVSIVTFTDIMQVVAPMTSDREDLKTRIKNIGKPQGGTSFWDSLRYVVETMLDPARTTRRSAVVVMTDGVDNALPDVPGEGSHTSFNELLAIVSRSPSIVIPIYLDTEREMVKQHLFFAKEASQTARRQLNMIATESGSKYYYARKVEDLKDAYKQVIRDLSTVYSLGYRSGNSARDGSWRTVKVELNGRPNLAARTKRGYFAK